MADHSSHNPPFRQTRHLLTKPYRPRYRAARSFYLTLLLLTCFATYTLFTHSFAQHGQSSNRLQNRDLDGLVGTLDMDEHCRMVHRAKDQCAFVRTHCPADEGGFSAYLDLYFCRLAHFKPIAAAILITWLGLLFSTIGIAASDFFCIDLSTIASILGMSESIAGVTFLAFGNGSSDVFSTFAAMSTNSGSLAVGELFGAAGFITAVVAGSMALIRPFKVSKKSFVRDVSFFIVAAAFSLVYLWDGKLRVWECISMVGYYILYVAFIIVWHWWLKRRRWRRERDAAIRSHFSFQDEEPDHTSRGYQDDPDERSESRQSSIIPQGFSQEDWSALERASQVSNAGTGAMDDVEQKDEEAEEEERERWMTELTTQMRLTRPDHGMRSRKNTLTPVRPSLVGALEFQAVLKSLQKSQNLQNTPVMMRRFSDDPVFRVAQQEERLSTAVSDPATQPEPQQGSNGQPGTQIERPSISYPVSSGVTTGRARAVSVNDAANFWVDYNLGRRDNAPFQNDPTNFMDGQAAAQQFASSLVPSEAISIPTRSPTVLVEPATPLPDAPIQTPEASTSESPNLLAPPGMRPYTFRTNNEQHLSPGPSHQHLHQVQDTSDVSPSYPFPRILVPEDQGSLSPTRMSSPSRFLESPLAETPRSSIGSRPPSLYLPGPMAPSESLPFLRVPDISQTKRPSRWWPYSIFPPPEAVMSALFPTVYHWSEKSWWEKCLGLVAMPSVFLLTITLPVVENDKDPEAAKPLPTRQSTFDVIGTKDFATTMSHTEGGSASVSNSSRPHGSGETSSGIAGHGNIPTVAITAEERSHGYGTLQSHRSSFASEPQIGLYPVLSQETCQPQLWNRWLTIIQLFLAPIFVLLAVYIQSPVDLTPSWLVLPTLICLLVSTVILIPLLCTSTPTHRPGIYRIILSLAGFVVSIAWISTIASQVVGALKALAVILNMSHAIMGLTIFAVGNSLGDLVADVTVAKLGYPVMALSACFGGPMLNILLGIGLSGSYILIQGAEKRHEKHPEKGMHFKVYHIEVSKTLIVSGVTLLITLVGLLIAVPLNKWIFSRRIGIALIALWTLTTIGNVVIEVTGWPSQAEALADWLGINAGNE